MQPESPDPPAHDAFTRLLHRLEPDPETLWDEARPLVHRKGGVLVLDDSTLDKPYAKKIDLVGRHWSGKHKRGRPGHQPDHPGLDRRRPRRSPATTGSTTRPRTA